MGKTTDWYEKNVDPDRYLYHYTIADTAISRIFSSMKLRFSSLSETNDPREYRKWNYTIRQGNMTHINYPFDPGGLPLPQKVTDETIDTSKIGWKLLCLTRDDPKYALTNYTTWWGRGLAHPRMWAQYAQDHTGLCIVIDKNKICAEFNKFQSEQKYCDKVDYDDHPSKDSLAYTIDVEDGESLLSAVQKHFVKRHREIFFLKNNDWKSEYEFRFVLHEQTTEEMYIDISGSLSGIVLGDLFSNRYMNEIEKLIGEFDIPTKRIKWRNGRASLSRTLTR